MNTPEELFAVGRYCENLIGADVKLAKNKRTLTIFDNEGKIVKQIPLEEIVKEYGVEEV